jgi:N-acyl-D-amino-acid deacylase
MRLSVLALLACAAFAQDAPYDVVLLGGRIVDGAGNPWFTGDLAIRGDRIARITPSPLLSGAAARVRIDAKGLVVAPGFIDIQSQSGNQFLNGDGRAISKITQGVTTEILGEGTTPAPANDRTAGPAIQPATRRFEGPHGFDAWLKAMQEHGISPNVGSFVGAGTIRMYVKGMDQGSPQAAEVESMQTLVRQAMEDGAFGIASALIYPPGNYAGTPELIAMAKAMSPYGGVYISHMRSEADQYLEAIDEAMEIGRQGGVPVEIYHLKAGGRRNWSKAAQAIAKIEAARAAGLDVGADMYSYTAGATGLTSCLPPAASEGGKLFDRLADPAARAGIRAEALKDNVSWENLCQLATPQGVLILGLARPENKQYVGKRLAEIAAMMHKDYLDAAMDLILSEHRRVETVYFMMSEENVKLQLQLPWMKIGTDAGGIDPETAIDLAHPRAYGNYTRILGKYVRDEKVLPLEDAVRKMTSAVATRLSIHDRGLLREGMFADVTVFDPATVADRATYDQPHQLSIGIRHVFVNGIAVLQDGKVTGARPGRVVRGPGYRPAP